MSDPIALIKNDHRVVEDLFREFEDVSDDSIESKSDLVASLRAELEHHMEMEETILYPRIKDHIPSEDDLVEESKAEHQVVKDILAELSLLPVSDQQFDAKVKVLNELVTHHVKEEEDGLLPQLEKRFNKDELEKLGEDLFAFKEEEK